MRHSTLAKKLVATSLARDRALLLTRHRTLADETLAEELRRICYANWMSEPLVARMASAAIRDLSKVAHTPRITAIRHWIDGIAKLTTGKFEVALRELGRAGDVFLSIDDVAGAAQTRVARLIAYGMTGRYDEAIAEGHLALKVFVKLGDQLAAGKIEMNLSNIVSRRGLHREAIRLCGSARQRFASIDEHEWQAMAENGLANSYSAVNDFDRAETLYRAAMKTALAAKMDVTVAEIEASLGDLAVFRGRYADALRLLEASRDRYESIDMPHQSAIAELEIADLYAALNLFDEARTAYALVAATFAKLHLRAEEARARLGLARVEAGQGRLDTALKELKRASTLYVRERNVEGSVSVGLEETRVLLQQNRVAAAGTTLGRIEIAIGRDLVRHRIEAYLLRGRICHAGGEFGAATTHLRKVLSIAAKTEDQEASRQAHTLLGEIAIQRGNSSQAATEFERAIADTETLSDAIGAADQFRVAFSGDKSLAYGRLFAIQLGRGDLEGAFNTHERNKARALQDAMTGRGRRAENTRLTAAIKGSRNELNRLYARVASASDDREDIELRIADKERHLSELRLRAEAANAKANSANKDIDLIASLRRAIPNDTTLVGYFDIDGMISAFVVEREGLRVVRDLATTDEVTRLSDALRMQFGTLRLGSKLPATLLGDIGRRSDAILDRLGSALFGKLTITAKKLVIVPSGPLNNIPFAALRTEGKYLVERHDISLSPAAAIWLKLARRRFLPGKASALLLDIADGSIPQARHEIAAIAPTFHEVRKLSGKKATAEAFLELAPDFDILHLACHGEFRADNPAFSNLRLADGRVTMRDISEIALKARLVTLSACETGRADVRPGDEIIGLARGFLAAGAGAIIVSMWNVNDASTAKLMKALYKSMQRKGDAASSLREAQTKLISQRMHPYHWAAFALIGK